jgi:hypothetical protein
VRSLSQLESNARRLAESRWLGALLAFSVFQWVWTNLVVSFSAVAVFLLLTAVIPRISWMMRKDWEPHRDDHTLQLLGMLFWAGVWAFHGIEHRPQQAAWASISAAIFLLYAFVAFLDRRASVAEERQQRADSNTG